MAYTTSDDILKYYNGLETDGNVTASNISQFIDEQSSIIDLRIGKKYELPITDTDDLNYLKIVCDKLVVCQIDKILRTFGFDEEEQMTRKRNYCKEAKEMLDELMNGDILLNTDQKSFSAIGYNKTFVYDDDCDCRQNLNDCEDE